MKSYIFFTDEGFTYDPNRKEIPNLQILGLGDGENVDEAFENFKKAEDYLSKFAFKKVVALEIIGDFIRGLEL